MTAQEKMQAGLEALGLPFKEIKCYGSQIMVTAISEGTARKWHSVLFGLSPERLRMGEGLDYNKENRNSVLVPTAHKVWRVWASL